MKVVLISFLWGNIGGGAAAVAKMVVEALKENGFEVVVITTHKKGKLKKYQENGITFYSFSPRNFYWVAEKESQPAAKKAAWQIVDIWNPHSYQVVGKILGLEKPDIVHVHKLRGLSPSVWMAARRAGIPRLVQTIHDFELLSPQGTLSGRVGDLIRENSWAVQPYIKLRATMSKAVNVATAPSNFLLRSFQDFGFFTVARTAVVPNSHGHSGEQLRRRQAGSQEKQGCPDGDVRLLYLGRLDEGKGILLLLQAFKQSCEKQPNLFLKVAGYGPLEDRIKDECARHPQMHYLGAVFGIEKERALEEADWLVMPTLLPESFGNVIIEAFSHGKPVIASAIGAVPEIISDGENGLLLPPGDVGALESLLIRTARDRTQSLNMAPACWGAANVYTTDNVFSEYLALYQG